MARIFGECGKAKQISGICAAHQDVAISNHQARVRSN